jgi:hypothetical protein
MKTNLVALVALMGGAVLVYCAMKNQDPRDVIRNALGASTTVRPIVPPAASGNSTGTDRKCLMQRTRL